MDADGIAWRDDPQSAFAAARDAGLPLLLYWGAGWCPPCNRIGSVLFGRPDFLALSRRFVALAIDGDRPGAQRLAEQLKLRSYPTLVVYRPDGAEVTRLPCELDGKRFVHTLELAVSARFTVAESLSVALSRERKLSDDEWRLLSFYAWDTDERQLLRNLDFAAIVASLTRACTLADASVRLEWLGLHAAAMAGETGIDQAAAIGRLDTTLADPVAVCLQLDIVIGYALDLVRFLTAPGSAERQRLVALWSRALEVLEQDDTLNTTDRLDALRTRVRLARLGSPEPQPAAALATAASSEPQPAAALATAASSEPQPAAALATAASSEPQLAAALRERIGAALAMAASPGLRHTLVDTGAGALADAGLAGDARQLLQAELAQSPAPFYLMHTLAALARREGDAAAALDWYERAWAGATGSATRLQWGVTYLLALLDLAPGDQQRGERCAQMLLAQFAATPDAYCQRNRSQVARVATALSGRADLGEHAVALLSTVRAGA